MRIRRRFCCTAGMGPHAPTGGAASRPSPIFQHQKHGGPRAGSRRRQSGAGMSARCASHEPNQESATRAVNKFNDMIVHLQLFRQIAVVRAPNWTCQSEYRSDAGNSATARTRGRVTAQRRCQRRGGYDLNYLVYQEDMQQNGGRRAESRGGLYRWSKMYNARMHIEFGRMRPPISCATIQKILHRGTAVGPDSEIAKR